MRCKPGDLVFVISDKIDPENIGAIGLVRFLVLPGEYCAPDGLLWDVDACSWFVETCGGEFLAEGDRTRFCLYADESLFPIRPAPELQPAPPQEVTA